MRWAACRTAAFRRLATGGYRPYLGHACPFPLRPLHKRRWDRLSGRDGRKAERPVLRALAIQRDVFWPEAAGLLLRVATGKADGSPLVSDAGDRRSPAAFRGSPVRLALCGEVIESAVEMRG
jgi:hypothetical protein